MELVSRREWGARPPLGRLPLEERDIRGICVHYTGMNADEQADHGNCAARVRAIQRYHMDHNGWLDIAYCADAETEILTKRGFRRYDELSDGDSVLTLNCEAGLAEWQPLLAVNVFDASPRPMILMEGCSHSSLTTRNHRWPVERYVRRFRSRALERGTRRREWTKLSAQYLKGFATSDTLRYFDRIPAAAACANLPRPRVYDDNYVELLAWFWTEGNVRLSRGKPTTGVAIYQSHEANPAYVKRIRRCLLALFGPPADALAKQGDVVPRWREARNGHKTEFFLNHVAGRQLLQDAPGKVVSPSFIASLTAGQLRLFLETSVDADGWRSPHGTRILTQKDKERLDAVQMGCALLGLRATLTPPPERYPSNGTKLTIFKDVGGYLWPRPAAKADGRFIRREVVHDGPVWCPTTPNGTWFARRRGTTYFTGNSHVFCKHGYVFEGRGFGIRSAANGTTEANDHYFAACFLGDDTRGRDDVTHAGRRALVQLVLAYHRRYPRARAVVPHSAFVQTECPGDELRRLIATADWAALA